MSNYPNKRAWLWKAAGTALTTASVVSLVQWYRRPLSAISTGEGTSPKSTLLAQYLPEAEFAGEVSVVIHAPAETIYAALHRLTIADMPLAKWLGEFRYLPGKLLGKQKPAAEAQAQPFLQYIQSEGGNIVLAEEQNREIVFGAIAKFHNLADQQVMPLRDAHEFVTFDQPDYQKLAMSIKLSPVDDGSGYRLTLTHGTHALSPASRWKFALYWLAIKPGGNLISWLMLDAVKSLAEKATSISDVVVRN
ncbi:MAG: hypothetical protein IT328_07815 [Caldilineaceae bacterium]|nr:hypothetical protein [Caldilineaceae bacterium]